MFEIEKNIPIKIDAKSTFLKQLNVGDSFVDDKHKPNTARALWIYTAKRCGIKVRTSAVDKGIRVWRVA